jgi:hypothetical protein
VAKLYIKTIATFVEDKCLRVPDAYKKIVQQSISYKNNGKLARLPRFTDTLNAKAGRVV